MAPVSERCATLDWAVSLYSGPLRSFDDYDDPEIKPFVNFAEVPLEVGFFRRGFLPRHADRLIIDKFSYYLGFDPSAVGPKDLARELGDGRVLQPRPKLFRLVAEHDLLFLFQVMCGWWEAYTPDDKILAEIRRGWAGEWTESDRWNGPEIPKYPGLPTAT